MNVSPATLAVWVNDDFACIKITGRASCTCSVDFRKLMLALRDKGWRRFILDLSDCQLMDSTFLGVLAGMGLRFSEEAAPLPVPVIELLNASERVFGLIDNLGVAHLFRLTTGPAIATGALQAVPAPPCAADREELQRTSLDAHNLLIQIDPKNAGKFKEVCKFLEEDLKKLGKKVNAPAV